MTHPSPFCNGPHDLCTAPSSWCDGPPCLRGRRLRALTGQLSAFLGLAGLQSVADWQTDPGTQPADPDPDPVTNLESQSEELRQLLRQKPATEP